MWYLVWLTNGRFRYVKLRNKHGIALAAYLSSFPEKRAIEPFPPRCTGVEIYTKNLEGKHYYCRETAFHLEYKWFRHLASQLAEAGFVKRTRRGFYTLPLHGHIWLFSRVSRAVVASLYGGSAYMISVSDVARLISAFTSNECIVAYHGERCSNGRCTEYSFSIICKDRGASILSSYVKKYGIRWIQVYDKRDVSVLEGVSIEPLLERWEQNGEASPELVAVLKHLSSEGWLSNRFHVFKVELRGSDKADVATRTMVADYVLRTTALIFGRRIDFT
jgi:hypothetical protein